MEITLILASAAATRVHLGSNGVRDVGQLLLLLLEILSASLSTVLVEPLSGLLDSVEDLRSMLVSVTRM